MGGGLPPERSGRPRRSRRWAWRSPRGSRCCCGARRAPARRRSIRAMAERPGLAVRDRDRLDPRAVRLRRAARRGRRRGAVRAARRGPGGWPRPGRGLLFLDELSTAPPGGAGGPAPGGAGAGGRRPRAAGRGGRGRGGQPARAGRRRLGPVRAAGQPALPPAWDIDPRAVADGLAGGWAPPPVPAAAGATGRPSSAWPSPWWPRSCTSGPALACAPPADADAAGRGWPSPRTWEMAARLLGRQRRGRVGRGGAVRPGPRRGGRGRRGGVPGLAGRDGPARPGGGAGRPGSGSCCPQRGDRAYAAVAAVAAVVAANPTPRALGRGLAGAGPGRRNRRPDVAAVAARTLARCRPDGAPPPAELQLFAPVLRDAGLLRG